jgi:hypothetical protein
MCGPKFGSMKITQEVGEFARLLEQNAATTPLPEQGGAGGGSTADPEEGMAERSTRFHDEGSELYVPAAE